MFMTKPSDAVRMLRVEVNCPACNKTLDAIFTPNGERPLPGDLSVCGHCRTFLRFTPGLMLSELTQEEIAQLDCDTRASLVRARQFLRDLCPTSP